MKCVAELLWPHSSFSLRCFARCPSEPRCLLSALWEMDVTSLIKMLVCSQILSLLGSHDWRSSAPCKHKRCWIQLCATLLHLDVVGCTVTPDFWDAWRLHVEAFEGISEVEKHRCNCVMLLERIWRWITGRHKLNYEPRRSSCNREGLRQCMGMGCQCQPPLSVGRSQSMWAWRCCSSAAAHPDVPDSIGTFGCSEATEANLDTCFSLSSVQVTWMPCPLPS